jgi:hypothetical protein
MAPKGNRIDVRPGDRVRLELPCSEVCMSMRVAGKVMTVVVTTGRYPMAQLIDGEGHEFSGPITTGEAGIYGYGAEMYAYGEWAS